MAEELRPKRLCTEIQLFDLCSREKCKYRDGRYCGDGDMIAKFEAISEEDEKNQFIADEEDELEEYDYDETDDGQYDIYDNENEDEDENEDE